MKGTKSGLRILMRKITKFSSHAISSSMEITIAEEPASPSSDLREDSFDPTSTPAYFRSCTLIGLLGGFGLESPHILSTRFMSYKYTNSWFFLDISSFNSSAASEEKRNCSLLRYKIR